MKLVNLGKCLPHCKLMITGDHSEPLPEDHTGHVLVSGGNISRDITEIRMKRLQS